MAGHPEADPATGAVHACGHNAQVAGLLGCAMGLLAAEVMPHLAGRVVFFAVPAEEGGDLGWRLRQRAEGRLEFLGGKCELIRLGHFDDVDLAMMIHTSARAEDGRASLPLSNNGRFGKTARFVGRAAHAGGAPHLGVNALYAAQISLAAINALRETFRDEDAIRVHPILTHGGSQVNVIPGEARLETYVRGRTLEGIRDANAKVDRALRAGALALGARVEIDTLPGYLPLRNDPTMARVFRANAMDLVGADQYREVGHRARLHRHGRSLARDAGAPSLHGRRPRQRSRARLRDCRSAPGLRGAGQDAGLDGGGHAGRGGGGCARGAGRRAPTDDAGPVRGVPARGRAATSVRGVRASEQRKGERRCRR